MNNSQTHRSQHRTILGASIVAAVVIVAIIMGFFIFTKGVGSSFSIIFSGIVFIIVLVLYWLRNEKDDANMEDHRE